MTQFAHIAGDSQSGFHTQLLSDHLRGVASRAGDFADTFGSRAWAEAAGLLHDLGKADPSWQQYLKYETGYDQTSRGRRGRHSSAGALFAADEFGSSGPAGPVTHAVSYVVAGHHTGLSDHNALAARLGDLRLSTEGANPDGDLASAAQFAAAEGILPLSLERLQERGHRYFRAEGLESNEQLSSFQLWVRMLYSCVVDADSLDTEAFAEPDRSVRRSAHPSLAELQVQLDRHLHELERGAAPSNVNRVRSAVLGECRAAAQLPRGNGLYSLTVPTGGGKTLASLSFAIDHALRNGQKRVIIALPFTSIIEQTAAVYKYGTTDPNAIARGATLFGEDGVLEHHSAFTVGDSLGDQYTRAQLAIENWDAPVIVTTNVQLFESLYGARRSKVRKIHNIANSVVVLDELQALPTEQLAPIIEVIKHLSTAYNTTFVFSTATQPTIQGEIGRPGAGIDAVVVGFKDVREIVSDPEGYQAALKRVDISVMDVLDSSTRVSHPGWAELATDLKKYPQVLCIVNTRAHCRALHGEMPPGTVHLSALMCPADRSDRIAEVRRDLAAGQPVRVISTQVVESGVDIDFPIVYRAMAGLDSIVQAAGRCNREGALGERGQVVVFETPDTQRSPGGQIGIARATALAVLSEPRYAANPGGASAIDLYFRKYFHSLRGFGAEEFRRCLVDGAPRGEFLFKEFDQKFQMIAKQGQRAVVVRYCDSSGLCSADLIREYEAAFIHGYSGGATLRKLQRFSVNVYEHEFRKLLSMGAIRAIGEEEKDGGGGLWVQSEGAPGLYRPGVGLVVDLPPEPLIL